MWVPLWKVLMMVVPWDSSASIFSFVLAYSRSHLPVTQLLRTTLAPVNSSYQAYLTSVTISEDKGNLYIPQFHT